MRTYGRVRDEFVDGPPAGTVVQVGALAVPGMMLEVEATAVVGAATQDQSTSAAISAQVAVRTSPCPTTHRGTPRASRSAPAAR